MSSLIVPICIDPEVNIGAFSEQFDSNGVTIVLKLTQGLLINVAYNISVVPGIPVRNIDSKKF